MSESRLTSWSVAFSEEAAAVVTKERGTDLIDVDLGPRNEPPMTMTLYPHQAARLISDLAAALGTYTDDRYPRG